MQAGTAMRNITPSEPVVLVTGATSTGVHDPLYTKALVLDDGTRSVAIVSIDLPLTTFTFTDTARSIIEERTGIPDLIINSTHTHSSPFQQKDEYLEAVVEVVTEAYKNRCPVSLHVGREAVQVGFNRRITDDKGRVSMGVNRKGVVVPWVNVLVARRLERAENQPAELAVLFEHAAHPVIVHSASDLISGDYPAHAATYIQERIGEGVTPIFVQGCGANINGHPLSSGHAAAQAAGRKLGDAVLKAIHGAEEVKAETLNVSTKSIMLESQSLPTIEVMEETQASLEVDYANQTEWGKPVTWITEEVYRDFAEKLRARKEMILRGEESLPRRYGATAIKLGREWCLVALEGETFCEYERWVDEAAPFAHTMTLGYTNGDSGYIADDAALALGSKGGYEAGTYPCWWAHGPTSDSGNTPAVGTEVAIKKCVESLW